MNYQTEECSECGRQLAAQEQACVFNGAIVCGSCDSKLRSDIHERNLCFFCQKTENDPTSSQVVPVYRVDNVESELHFLAEHKAVTLPATASHYSRSYLLCRVIIPRCPECKAYHKRNKKLNNWLVCSMFLMSVFVGTLAAYFIGIQRTRNDPRLTIGEFMFFGAFVGIAAGCILAPLAGVVEIYTRTIRRKDIRPVRVQKQFPFLRQLIKLGWWYGERPQSKRKLSPIEVDATRLAQILPEPKADTVRMPLLIGGGLLCFLIGSGLIIFGVVQVVGSMGESIVIISGLGVAAVGLGSFVAAVKMLRRTGIW